MKTEGKEKLFNEVHTLLPRRKSLEFRVCPLRKNNNKRETLLK